MENKGRLSKAADAALSDPAAGFIIPTMVLVEIIFLHSKGRFATDLSATLAHISGTPNGSIHSLDEEVVRHVPTGLDIHDAIIVAPGIVYRDVKKENTAVITKDKTIAQTGLIPIVW